MTGLKERLAPGMAASVGQLIDLTAKTNPSLGVATLITPDHALTSAHIVFKYEPYLNALELYFPQLRERRRILEIELHPGFDKADAFRLSKQSYFQMMGSLPLLDNNLALLSLGAGRPSPPANLAQQLDPYMACALPEQKSGMSGSLSEIDLIAILQTLINSRKDGNLVLLDGRNKPTGMFLLHAGKLISVRYKNLQGEEALYQLLTENLSDCFIFYPGTDSPWGTASATQRRTNSGISTKGVLIQRPLEMMLMEGCRRSDELPKLKESLGGEESIYKRRAEQLDLRNIPAEASGTAPLLWDNLDGRLNLKDLVDCVDADWYSCYFALSELMQAGLIERLDRQFEGASNGTARSVRLAPDLPLSNGEEILGCSVNAFNHAYQNKAGHILGRITPHDMHHLIHDLEFPGDVAGSPLVKDNCLIGVHSGRLPHSATQLSLSKCVWIDSFYDLPSSGERPRGRRTFTTMSSLSTQPASNAATTAFTAADIEAGCLGVAMIICPRCRKENPASAEKCEFCQISFLEEHEEMQPAQLKNNLIATALLCTAMMTALIATTFDAVLRSGAGVNSGGTAVMSVAGILALAEIYVFFRFRNSGSSQVLPSETAGSSAAHLSQYGTAGNATLVGVPKLQNFDPAAADAGAESTSAAAKAATMEPGSWKPNRFLIGSCIMQSLMIVILCFSVGVNFPGKGGLLDFVAATLEYGVGNDSYRLGRWHQALDHYSKAVGIYSDDARTLNDLGRVAMDLDDPGTAAHALSKAVSLNSKNARIWLSLCRARLFNGAKIADLQMEAQRAVELGPKDAEAACISAILSCKTQAELPEKLDRLAEQFPLSPFPNYCKAALLSTAQQSTDQAISQAAQLAQSDEQLATKIAGLPIRTVIARKLAELQAPGADHSSSAVAAELNAFSHASLPDASLAYGQNAALLVEFLTPSQAPYLKESLTLAKASPEEIQECIACLRQVLNVHSANPRVLNTLSAFLYCQGSSAQEASRYAVQASELDPEWSCAWINQFYAAAQENNKSEMDRIAADAGKACKSPREVLSLATQLSRISKDSKKIALVTHESADTKGGAENGASAVTPSSEGTNAGTAATADSTVTPASGGSGAPAGSGSVVPPSVEPAASKDGSGNSKLAMVPSTAKSGLVNESVAKNPPPAKASGTAASGAVSDSVQANKGALVKNPSVAGKEAQGKDLKNASKEAQGKEAKNASKDSQGKDSKTASKDAKPAPSAVEVGAYISYINKAVSRNWKPPGGHGRVVISFTVEADGSVKNVKVSRSSGNSAYDKSALNAVSAAAPLHSPPSGTATEVQLTME